MAGPSKASKTTRANTGKSDQQQDGKPIKVTLYVAPKLAKQFATHAIQMEQTKSDLFSEMIQTHCRRFVVHDHAKGAIQGRSDDDAKGGSGEEITVPGQGA